MFRWEQGNTIFVTGNVGIGQTSPNVTLGVSGRANITGYLEVGGGLNVSNGMNVISGNVGIGTTGPGTDIVGTYDYTATPILQADGATPRLIARGSTSGGLDLVDTGAATNEKWMQLITDGGITYFRSLSDVGDIQANNILVLNNSNGNVGIGTTAPRSILELQGTAAAFLSIDTAGASNNAGIDFLDAGNLKWEIYNLGDGDKLYFDSVGTAGTRMVIQQDGNVGIGTTGPIGTLEVKHKGTGFSNGLILRKTDTNDAYSIINVGNLYIGYATDASGGDADGDFASRLMIESTTGNVGIGTTAPNFILDAAGKINSTGVITNEASGAITTCSVGEIRGNATANKICLCTTANNWKCAAVS